MRVSDRRSIQKTTGCRFRSDLPLALTLKRIESMKRQTEAAVLMKMMRFDCVSCCLDWSFDSPRLTSSLVIESFGRWAPPTRMNSTPFSLLSAIASLITTCNELIGSVHHRKQWQRHQLAVRNLRDRADAWGIRCWTAHETRFGFCRQGSYYSHVLKVKSRLNRPMAVWRQTKRLDGVGIERLNTQKSVEANFYFSPTTAPQWLALVMKLWETS